LPVANWIRLFVWLAIGLAIYFSYGIRHSHITLQNREANAKLAAGRK
jgi:basic amino acid/polyamine antiporter, APA family